ncbi:MAG: DnaD domain protein, partial [Clostridia bacterium]|nr:DnaD domain protein [Clostridia bacterium]
EDMKNLSETELKLFLLSVMFAHGTQKAEWETVAAHSGYSMRQCVEALQGLEQKKLIQLTPTQVTILSPEPEAVLNPVAFKEYTPEEIAAMDDDEITNLTACAEKSFGKLLSYGDISVLVSLYRWVGMEPSVLMILIEYVAALGKKSMGYLKNAALDWHNRGIDTAEAAHAYITYLEQQKEYYASMRDVLGIFGREFTKKEKEFLDKWKDVFTPEQIRDAYETTINSTGKISFAYMDKVLTSDGKPQKPIPSEGNGKKRVTPSKFSNFDPRKKDYDAVREKARERAKKLAKDL